MILSIKSSIGRVSLILGTIAIEIIFSANKDFINTFATAGLIDWNNRLGRLFIKECHTFLHFGIHLFNNIIQEHRIAIVTIYTNMIHKRHIIIEIS